MKKTTMINDTNWNSYNSLTNESKKDVFANEAGIISQGKRDRIRSSPKSWHEINWKEAREKINKIQEEIVIATRENDLKKIYRLQWKLLNNFSARALAVRKVITNSGGKTCGVDKVVWKEPKEFHKAVLDLLQIVIKPEKYIALPLRRVYIPKGNKGEKRPLGIPTMMDRAVQALYHLAIDPVVEEWSDPNSFGFRKNRSTHDAIIALRSHMDKKSHPRWILEADISKCFDRISHDFLMKNTPICHKNVLEQWLKSGVMENGYLLDTDSGTPQGGIISPTLCNIALNGIEKEIMKANPYKKGLSSGVHVIRYADDIIITGKDENICKLNKEILSEFLRERYLKLNEMKTKITHIKTGFDFLGFNVRRMTYDPRLNKPTDQATVLVIKPAKKGIKKLKENIKSKIDINKPIDAIIRDVNPILRGWGEHKRISYHSQEVFITLDHWIYTIMSKWATKHGGSKFKAVERYVLQTNTRKWNWGLSVGKKLLNLGEIPIISPRPMKLNKNPYEVANQEYFNKRKERLIFAKFRAAIYKKFNNVCTECGETLHNGENIELHHIKPIKQGGKYRMDNIQPVHRICHQRISHSTSKVLEDEVS